MEQGKKRQRGRSEHRENRNESGQSPINEFEWLLIATRGIRFKPDRAAVRSELEAHLEDKRADLQRIFPNLSHEEAQARTLEAMGDPAELGRELARIHKPWLGYLWVASRWALGLSLALAVVLWGGRGLSELENRRTLEEVNQGKVPYGEQVYEYYFAGDPAASFPRQEGEIQGETGITRTPVRWAEETETIRAGLYTLAVTRGALWRLEGESIEEPGAESPRYVLECELTVTGLPGLPLHPEAAYQISGLDSLGNTYQNTRGGHSTGQPYILAMELAGQGLEQRYRLSVWEVPPEAEWFRLEYSWGGVGWNLTVPLKEERV